jgi:hypothetical protein
MDFKTAPLNFPASNPQLSTRWSGAHQRHGRAPGTVLIGTADTTDAHAIDRARRETGDDDVPGVRPDARNLGIGKQTEEQKKAVAKLAELGLVLVPSMPEGTTFINPEIEDEFEDWHNRGRLLAAYRALKKEVL